MLTRTLLEPLPVGGRTAFPVSVAVGVEELATASLVKWSRSVTWIARMRRCEPAWFSLQFARRTIRSWGGPFRSTLGPQHQLVVEDEAGARLSFLWNSPQVFSLEQ